MSYEEEYGDEQDSGSGTYVKFETKGEKVSGVYEGKQPSTKYEGTFIGKVRTKDGLVAFGINKPLQDRLAPVREGYWITITYKGKVQSKTGQMYKDFDLTFRVPKAKAEVPF